jgi:nitrate/TMAO reductase-like tetraheme cytochrome c subunit
MKVIEINNMKFCRVFQPNVILWLWGLVILSACGGDDSEIEQPVSLASANLIVGTTHGQAGAAYGLADCSACHAMTVIHENAPLIRDIVVSKGFATCMGCHGDNGTGKIRPCGICHNTTDLPHTPWQTGQLFHDFDATMTKTLTDTDCVACHYSSDMNGEFIPHIDLTAYPTAGGYSIPYNNISEFCLRCHNRDNPQLGFEITEQAYNQPLIAMADNYRFIDKHGWVDGMGNRTYTGLRHNYQYQSLVACTDCHAMHGTNNHGLLIDNSSKGASKLALAEHSVVVENGNYAQLCVLCHQMTTVLEEGDKDTGNGLSGVHAISGDCRSCHSHGETVQAGL